MATSTATRCAAPRAAVRVAGRARAQRRAAAPRRAAARALGLDAAMSSKLQQAERTLAELTQQMSDPDVINNSDEYQKVAKNASDMEKVRHEGRTSGERLCHSAARPRACCTGLARAGRAAALPRVRCF